MMRSILNSNKFFIIIYIVAGTICSYSFSSHFLDLFIQTKFVKLGYLLALIPIFSIIIFFLLRLIILPTFRHASSLSISLIIAAALTSLIFFYSNIYQIIPMYTVHNLEIIIPESDEGNQIEIRNLYYSEAGPSASIPSTELAFFGDWEIDQNTYLSNVPGSSLTFQNKWLGGLTITFRSNPSKGKVIVIWDGQKQQIDTFEFINTEIEISLPANSWGTPRPNWVAMGITLLFSDFLSMIFLIILGLCILLKALELLKIIKTPLMIAGILLILTNITGLFITMRNPDLNGQIWEENRVRSVIQRQTPDREERLEELNTAIHNGIADYWDDEDIKKYNLRVPFYENYILFLQRWNLKPEYHRKYEFANETKALERGVGICSQKSIILFNILQQENIPAKIIGLPGHVMVTAEVNNHQWWMLDPDYGVIIHHDLSEIIKNPEIIRTDYQAAGYNDTTIDILVEIYGRGKITPYNNLEAYFDKTYIANEKNAYILIWVYPLLLFLPSIYSRIDKILIK